MSSVQTDLDFITNSSHLLQLVTIRHALSRDIHYISFHFVCPQDYDSLPADLSNYLEMYAFIFMPPYLLALISVHSWTPGNFSSVLLLLRKIWISIELEAECDLCGPVHCLGWGLQFSIKWATEQYFTGQDYTSLCACLIRLRALRDYFTLICSHTGHLDRDHTFIKSKNSSITKQNMYGVSQPNR